MCATAAGFCLANSRASVTFLSEPGAPSASGVTGAGRLGVSATTALSWLPTAGAALAWDASGSATAEGTTPVRELNRVLGLSLPTDGPKTLNGLIVEHLQDIPEADVSIKIGNVPMEIAHAQGRTIKTVRIFKPVEFVENTESSEA